MSDLVVFIDSQDSELVNVNQGSSLELFKDVSTLSGLLDQIESAVLSQSMDDVSTLKGRKDIASLAHKVARTKTYLDGIGKEVVDDLKALPKLIDSNRKQVRDRLDALKDKVRQPLTDWENEQKRIEERKAVISEAIEVLKSYPSRLIGLGSSEMLSVLNAMVKPVESGFDDRYTEAMDAYTSSLSLCQEMLESRKLFESREREEYEKKIAEQARVKAEADAELAVQKAKHEQERAESEAKARIAEAEQRAKKAEEDRVAAETREKAEREAAIKREEQARIDAEAAAKKMAEESAAAERKRIAEDAARVEHEKQKREADVKHRKHVNNEVLKALTALNLGLDEDAAKALISAIVRNQIPHVQLLY